jgi:hypothetical protein
MTEIQSKSFKWTELYNPEYLYNFAVDLKYFNVNDVDHDEFFQRTTLNGTQAYGSSQFNKDYELVPGKATLCKDKTIKLFLTQTFNLNSFSQIMEFINRHCSYISEYIQDQNIETVSIGINKEVRYTTNLEGVIERITDFNLIKNWMEKENNSEELFPLILATLIQNFYQQDTSTFNIRSTSALSRIKNNIHHVNTLMNTNINLLKTYKIKPDIDVCIKNGRTFEFLNNQILNTHTFSIYEQNIDLKYLSYISCADLKEKASKVETVAFGESYFKRENNNAENYSNIL